MEREFAEWLRAHVPVKAGLPLGLRDDAALLPWHAGEDIVVTTDMICDGTHFDLASGDAPQRIGRKALAVNLSDLAAMAAEPVAAFVSIAVPRNEGPASAKAIYEGILPLAEQFECAVAGGDTNTWDGGLVINVTAVGKKAPGKAWSRDGAKAGDWLLVTGELGGSRRGKHFDFTPRVREARLLAESYVINAAMDVSDGLAIDLSRMLEASSCGATLMAANVPVATAAHESSATDGTSALEHALSDGEDFELLLAVSPDEAARLMEDQPLDTALTHVGSAMSGSGMVLIEGDGTQRELQPTGYEHQ